MPKMELACVTSVRPRTRPMMNNTSATPPPRRASPSCAVCVCLCMLHHQLGSLLAMLFILQETMVKRNRKAHGSELYGHELHATFERLSAHIISRSIFLNYLKYELAGQALKSVPFVCPLCFHTQLPHTLSLSLSPPGLPVKGPAPKNRPHQGVYTDPFTIP